MWSMSAMVSPVSRSVWSRQVVNWRRVPVNLPGGGVHLHQPAVGRVAEQPAQAGGGPGALRGGDDVGEGVGVDRAVAAEQAGFAVQTEPGRQRHHHLHLHVDRHPPGAGGLPVRLGSGSASGSELVRGSVRVGVAVPAVLLRRRVGVGHRGSRRRRRWPPRARARWSTASPAPPRCPRPARPGRPGRPGRSAVAVGWSVSPRLGAGVTWRLCRGGVRRPGRRAGCSAVGGRRRRACRGWCGRCGCRSPVLPRPAGWPTRLRCPATGH